MPDNPSAYGSYMNFFLPRSAQVGPSVVPTPGLFDMMGGMGLGGWGGSQTATPADQQKKQQQNLAMAQQGIKMMYPQQPAQPAPPPIPVQQPPTAANAAGHASHAECPAAAASANRLQRSARSAQPQPDGRHAHPVRRTLPVIISKVM